MATDLFGRTIATPKINNGLEITGRIHAATAKAVQFDNGELRVWLPKSEILIDGAAGDSATIPASNRIVTITLPAWLAKEKELSE